MIQGGDAKSSLKKVNTPAVANRRMSMPAARKGSNLESSEAFTRMQNMQALREGPVADGKGDDSDDAWSDDD
jgi:hypothetical protein